MIKIIRTNSENPDFRTLVQQLDKDLAIRDDGAEHSFYAQFNTLDTIKHVIIFYNNEKAIACGAFKEYDTTTTEIKRMYTTPESRGQGIASQILIKLEQWAAELSYNTCILETGKKQPEAIRLYKKNGYCITPNYGQYATVENSVCFLKKL